MTTPKRTPEIRLRFARGPLGRLSDLLADPNDETELNTLARELLTLQVRQLDAAIHGNKFTRNEVMLMLDAVNSWLMDASSAAYLAAEIEDSLEDGLAEKWSVDGPALLAKLRALDGFTAAATSYALKAAWATAERHGGLEGAARALGLMRASEEAGQKL